MRILRLMLRFYPGYFIGGIHTQGMSARFAAHADHFMRLMHECERIYDSTSIANRTLIAFLYLKSAEVLQSVENGTACMSQKMTSLG
jgi:hypothetical protein